jgi:hypothetical protein
MVEVSDYGNVKIIAGRNKGKVGYYDNDEQLTKALRAVVYLEGESDYIFVNHDYLERLPDSVALNDSEIVKALKQQDLGMLGV